MLNTARSTSKAGTAMEHMLRRIQGEFLEMPGLRLTCRQAQRLWNLDEVICEALLAALVDVRFLVRTTDGVFVQRTDFNAPMKTVS
jgi:hypothetical protein